MHISTKKAIGHGYIYRDALQDNPLIQHALPPRKWETSKARYTLDAFYTAFSLYTKLYLLILAHNKARYTLDAFYTAFSLYTTLY